MDQETIKAIAEQISAQTFLPQWKIWGLQFTLWIIGTFLAAYLGAYYAKRGEHKAISADFKILKDHLEQNTKAVKTIETEIAHEDWATRELKTLKRVKLEELLSAIYEVQNWQQLEISSRIYNSAKEPGDSPLPKVELISGLYFPELSVNKFTYCQLHREMVKEIIRARKNILNAGNDFTINAQALDQFAAAWAPLYENQLKAIANIEFQCREIMNKLVGVLGT